MLDTIILQIPLRYAMIQNHYKFNPPTIDLLSIKSSFRKFVNNASAADRADKIYRPKLTAIKRGYQIYLKIEFSAPKLLFGNNLDELEETDFGKIVELLRKNIIEMGVEVSPDELEKAEVISFHPSKNIVLKDGYPADFVIRELYKANIDKTFDVDKVSFRNGGQSLQFYTNSHSFVIYDKISDLNQPKKRAMDKDQTAQQKSLFDDIKSKNKSLEVIRFEVRLSKKVKMNEILKEVGYSENPTFKGVFNKTLCQKIVQRYWDKFFGSSSFLFSITDNPQKILLSMRSENPRIKIKKAIFLAGLIILCKDDGIRTLRSNVEALWGKDSWVSINREIRSLSSPKPIDLCSYVKDIEQQIRDFMPLRL